MNNLIISSDFIERYKYEQEIINQTAEQVIKDFGMFGIKITFSGDTGMAYNELFNQLSVQIAKLLKTDYSKLQNILYQVDINIKKLYGEGNDYNTEEKVAEAVLDREFKKVLTRLYFKLHPDKI